MEEQQEPIAHFNFSSSLSNELGWQEVQTKTTIVTRLFNQGHINFHEATILLKEFVIMEKQNEKENYWFKYPYTYPFQPYNDGKYNHWEHCSCNPKNGGSGVCNCTLNQPFTFSRDHFSNNNENENNK